MHGHMYMWLVTANMCMLRLEPTRILAYGGESPQHPDTYAQVT